MADRDPPDAVPNATTVSAAAGDGAELAPGATIGPYRVDGRLGAGGFGRVYLARHLQLERAAAVKVLHPELATSPPHVERFHREARAVTRIGHPGIATIYDLGALPDGSPYYAMELIDGTDLGAVVRERGALPVADVCRVIDAVAAALDAAHACGVIHRDVKASNVMLGCDDRVVLLDFGVAKLLEQPAGATLTRTGARVGTPAFMAPEQLAGGAVDARTDVYALGALAFHMLAGEPPFSDDSATVLRAIKRAARPRLRDRVPVDAAIAEVVERALERAPGDRYPSAGAFAAALRAAATGAVARLEPAVGVYVAAVVDDAALAAADDALLAALDRALATADAALRAEGFTRALDLGTAALYSRADRDDARAAADRALAALATACSPDPRVALAACAHAAPALLTGDRARGGALTRLSDWVPADLAGVVPLVS